MRKIGNIRNTILVFAILSLGAAVALYWYMYNATSAITRDTLAAKQAILSAQTARIQGKDIVKIYEETREKRERLSSLYVPAENAVAVIQAIEAVGETSGAAVSISSIKSVAPADTKDKMGQVNAAVGISGSWSDVMQALELFETLPYQKTMRNLTVNSLGADGKDGNRWQINFDLSIFTIQKP